MGARFVKVDTGASGKIAPGQLSHGGSQRYAQRRKEMNDPQSSLYRTTSA